MGEDFCDVPGEFLLSFGLSGSAVLDAVVAEGYGGRNVGRSGNSVFVIRFIMRLQQHTNTNLIE